MERPKTTVIKIGGAGIEDSERMKAFADIISRSWKGERIIIVCSAIKGVTRLLVEIFNALKDSESTLLEGKIKDFEMIHSKIISELSPNKKTIHKSFNSLLRKLKDLVASQSSSEEMYASILQIGELASSKIVSQYFISVGLRNTYFDIRKDMKTTGPANLASIHPKSQELIAKSVPKLFGKSKILVTQGFIGQDYDSGCNTILPFDGSDISAAFIAHSIEATKMIFLKDVCGVCRTDVHPPHDTTNYYQGMTHDGYLRKFSKKVAYPVHPKAIAILKKKTIPVRVCSFKYPYLYGTEIRT